MNEKAFEVFNNAACSIDRVTRVWCSDQRRNENEYVITYMVDRSFPYFFSVDLTNEDTICHDLIFDRNDYVYEECLNYYQMDKHQVKKDLIFQRLQSTVNEAQELYEASENLKKVLVKAYRELKGNF